MEKGLFFYGLLNISPFSFCFQISYLSRDNVETLFAALFELIGLPNANESTTYISQQQIVHLIEIIDRTPEKKLTRKQFLNIRNTNWTDVNDGVGTLLIEHSC